MLIAIKFFHVLISLVLIFVVLLQTGKADMGAAFGGGSSNSLFGATGANTFMSKLTTFMAILFVVTSLSLAYMSDDTATSSVMDKARTEAPAKEAPPPMEGIPTETGMPASMPAKEGGTPVSPAAPIQENAVPAAPAK